MRLITIVLAILLFGGACGQQVPEGVVPQRQMGTLLLDMHLADGRLASMMPDSARIYRDAYYGAIFNRYGIDSTTFVRSIEFYSTRPQLMKTMYVNIEKQLEAYNTAEQRAITEKYDAQRRADSIVSALRTDSLRKVERDSLDFKRKRYLLYLNGPDSLAAYGQPVPVTFMLLRERLKEATGLPHISPSGASHSLPAPPPVAPIPTPEVEQQTKPALKPLRKIN